MDLQGLSGSDIMIIGGNSHPDLVNLIAKYIIHLFILKSIKVLQL